MLGVLIAFMIVATIFALASLAYVVIDMILERRRKEKEEEQETPPVVVVPVVAAPESEPQAEPEVMPEFVEHIDAEEADAMISDELAMQTVRYESPAGTGEQGIINIGVIDAMFEANDVITLDLLKEKKLLTQKTGRLKVLADGVLNKPLTIKAESYSIQAIKMIELTGGTVIILKD